MVVLKDVVKDIGLISFSGDMDSVISGVAFDSRKVASGTLFLAVKGTKTDGHNYIGEAIKSGASAVICETLPEVADAGVTWIKTDDSARALGIIASNYYGNPSSLLRLVGVTGTNGKTTIVTLLHRLFTNLGYRCGLFSTVCNYIIEKEFPATHTTPDPVQINRLMSEMVMEGCEFAFMEVSSHSADQQRIAGLKFAGGVFTNLTHDHLDYHKTFDKYLQAKKSFFDSLQSGSFALSNTDDKNGMVMLQNCNAHKYTYSVGGMADYRCKIIEQGFEGMNLRINGEEIWTRCIGEFNASNLLAVYAASDLLNADRKEVLPILSDLRPVTGRLELIETQSGRLGIVDYAHTPDALFNVIKTLNKLREKRQKLITVVGAGGDRDRIKRPQMAAIAAEGSTRLILTSDNPRTEDPEKILDDMESGITPEMKSKTLRIADRREAIKTAVMLSEPGDVILLAGKGHETYQEINDVKHHFDDRIELRLALSTQ